MADTFDSTDDKRTSNNTARHQYRTLSDVEKEQMEALRDLGEAMIEMCDRVGSSREMSLAKTKIEEAVMWTTKHVTK